MTEEVRILSQKLSVLISLLKHSIHQGSNAAMEVPVEVTDTSQEKRPTAQRIQNPKFVTAMGGPSAPTKDYVILKL